MKLEELRNNIINNVVSVVTFTKKNGEKRIMPCTLNTDLLRAMADKGESLYRPPVGSPIYEAQSYNQLRVWDLKNDGWRTIDADTVESVEKCDF